MAGCRNNRNKAARCIPFLSGEPRSACVIRICMSQHGDILHSALSLLQSLGPVPLTLTLRPVFNSGQGLRCLSLPIAAMPQEELQG